jgi:hypothetical protein
MPCTQRACISRARRVVSCRGVACGRSCRHAWGCDGGHSTGWWHRWLSHLEGELHRRAHHVAEDARGGQDVDPVVAHAPGRAVGPALYLWSAKALPFIVVTSRSRFPLLSRSATSGIEYACSPRSTQSVQPVRELTRYLRCAAPRRVNQPCTACQRPARSPRGAQLQSQLPPTAARDQRVCEAGRQSACGCAREHSARDHGESVHQPVEGGHQQPGHGPARACVWPATPRPPHHR